MVAWRAMEQAPDPSPVRAGSALVALVAVAVVTGVFAGDGSDVGGILPVGGAAVALLAAAVAAVGVGLLPAPRIGRTGLLLVASFLALVAWIGASIAWSVAPDRSWDAFNRAAAFVVFLGLGLVLGAAARGFAVRAWASVLAGVLGATLGWALLGKAIPSLDPEGELVARLNEPVDYWNALALLADVAIVLGLWLATEHVLRLGARVAGGLLVYAAALSLALTLSRVGVVGAVIVVALWLALSPERVRGAVVLAAAGVPAAAVSGWAFTRPALVEPGATGDERAADGAVFAVLAIAGAVVACALVVLVLRITVDERRRVRLTRGLVALGVTVAVAGLATGVLALGNAIASGRSCAEVANTPSRFGSIDLNSRWCWWNEAWDVFVANAPEGAGAGTFEVARKRYREDARAVREPHSVPLRQLADGGVLALGLFLVVLGAGGAACACALRRLDGAERTAALALVAAPAGYAVHSLVDYEWDFLATTGPVLVSLGVLVSSGRADPGGRPRRSVALVVGSFALALGLVVSFAAPWMSQREVRASTRSLIAGELDTAREQAERARSWNPLSVEPVVALARVEEQARDFSEAQQRYVQAVELQPENPETWYALGIFELEVRADFCRAYRFLNEAYTRDPAGRQWYPGGPLDVARDAVDAGGCETG